LSLRDVRAQPSQVPEDNPWRLHQDLKRGQTQMISQAWEQHCRDRQHVSKSPKEVLHVMHQEWNSSMQSFLNEPFVMKIDITPEMPETLAYKEVLDTETATAYKATQPLVGEIYTATEQISKQAQLRGHRTSASMSLENGWDFRKAEHRKACIKKVLEEDPFCLILAFPCGPWSPLTRLRASSTLEERRKEGEVLLDFALILAKIQSRRGGHFVIENPKGSMAWNLPQMMRFLEETGCAVVDFDQCRFRLKSLRGVLHKKPTRIATSSAAVADGLRDCLCPGDHPHYPVMGGSKITSRAGHYPIPLAKNIVKSLEKQFHLQHAHGREVHAVDGEEAAGDDTAMDAFGSDSDISSIAEEDEDGEEKSQRVPAAIRAAVKRLHESTGHRSNRRLARALVISGAPKEVVAAAKYLRCSLCEEKKRPKSRRPATLPTPKDVSDQVHIDVVEMFDINNKRFYVVHCIDWTSRFQMAEALEHKSSEAITKWFRERWLPIFGAPRVLVADQGREFVSWEFQELCDQIGTLLHHIPVQAPWANGICERGGGILKALVECGVKAHSIQGLEEINQMVQESILAYNADVNEMGVSPHQAAIGRQPRMVGDVLGSTGQRLAEHGLIDSRPSLARQIALRETARVAMTRLHFSRGLRKAELSRSRSSTMSQPLEPGAIVYFWRESKYNARTAPSRRRLILRRWHGPALLVALEGHTAGYVSFKGQLTKCAREHLRLASSMEQISAEVWHDSIRETIEAAVHDMQLRDQPPQQQESAPPTAPPTPRSRARQQSSHFHASQSQQPQPQVQQAVQSPPQPETAEVPEQELQDLPPVRAEEMVAALAPASHELTSTPLSSYQQSLAASRRMSRVEPYPTSLPSQPTVDTFGEALTEVMRRAREADDETKKRAASLEPDALREASREQEPLVPPQSVEPPAGSGSHDVLVTNTTTSTADIDILSGKEHPLKLLYDQVQQDAKNPLYEDVVDHGTWSGRWPLPSRSTWMAHEKCKALWPCSSHEVFAAKTARREIKWKQIPEEQKEAFRQAAAVGWQVQLDNDAFQVIPEPEATRIKSRLKASGQLHKILVPRFVFTDKNDGVRSESNPMPLRANARLVIPGYQDETAYGLRKDAPTATRTSQHLLFLVAASDGWHLWAADIKSAFLKGEVFEEGERELYICNIRILSADEPLLPLGSGNLARLRKGVFGLADSPRRWYLRLHRSLTQLGWERSVMDAAMWTLRDGQGNLQGIVLSHVDDLLLGGTQVAYESIRKLGEELGFGSFEKDSFTYCGKKIERNDDHSITVSMKAYHENLHPVSVVTHRKQQLDEPLTPAEHRQLRGLIGSMQWLVTQVRIDMAFQLSTLQGDRPTVKTLLKANALVRLFKLNPGFKLTFQPMDLRGAGITVVTDASLGNVTRTGSDEGTLMTKTFSQAAYMVLIGDRNLMAGREGQCAFIDGRSHRLSRVCRSTCSAELQGAEEALDNGVFSRGLLADLFGWDVLDKTQNYNMAIPLNLVTDAKDVYDKGMTDTATYGSQKSLAFTIAWMREVFRKPRTSLSWTSTENMPVDCGTKAMDTSHLVKILNTGRWGVTYNASFVKQNVKKRLPPRQRGPVLPGRLLTDDTLRGHLIKLSELPGWHFREDYVIHVCRNAKSLRTPEPRFKPAQYPIRSSFGRFDSLVQSEWRVLEEDEMYSGKSLIGDVADVLITFFRGPHSQLLIHKEKDRLKKHACISTGM